MVTNNLSLLDDGDIINRGGAYYEVKKESNWCDMDSDFCLDCPFGANCDSIGFGFAVVSSAEGQEFYKKNNIDQSLVF